MQIILRKSNEFACRFIKLHDFSVVRQSVFSVQKHEQVVVEAYFFTDNLQNRCTPPWNSTSLYRNKKYWPNIPSYKIISNKWCFIFKNEKLTEPHNIFIVVCSTVLNRPNQYLWSTLLRMELRRSSYKHNLIIWHSWIRSFILSHLSCFILPIFAVGIGIDNFPRLFLGFRIVFAGEMRNDGDKKRGGRKKWTDFMFYLEKHRKITWPYWKILFSASSKCCSSP